MPADPALSPDLSRYDFSPATGDDLPGIREMIGEFCKEQEAYSLVHSLAADPGSLADLIAMRVQTQAGDPIFCARHYSEQGKPTPVGVTLWLALPQIVDKMANREVTALGTFIAPEHRQKGLATELRNAAMLWAKEAGFVRIVGTVHPTNEAGMKSLRGKGWMIAYHCVTREL